MFYCIIETDYLSLTSQPANPSTSQPANQPTQPPPNPANQHTGGGECFLERNRPKWGGRHVNLVAGWNAVFLRAGNFRFCSRVASIFEEKEHSDAECVLVLVPVGPAWASFWFPEAGDFLTLFTVNLFKWMRQTWICTMLF